MPWVAIKTGIAGPDGQETVLREYQCDWPGCAHTAEQVIGVVRHVAMVCAMCPEHAPLKQDGAPSTRAD
jgi:hypothetical protein